MAIDMPKTLYDKLCEDHVVRIEEDGTSRISAKSAEERRNAMFRFVSAVVSIAVFVLAGCNTVQGVGKDIEKGGEAIQKAVR